MNATDERGRSPLMLAASRGHTEVCLALLEAGADPALRDHEGNDAASLAGKAGQGQLAQLISAAAEKKAGSNTAGHAARDERSQHSTRHRKWG